MNTLANNEDSMNTLADEAQTVANPGIVTHKQIFAAIIFVGFAVLEMNPDMATGQWLLITLTAGVGGSLLSIGSAAGIALMARRVANIHFLDT